jgi:3',5'-nucleoside bisphosphate phosphatase
MPSARTATMAAVAIDLHAHTHASDGSLPPSDVVARAAARGITTLAITDHDTLDGLDEAVAAGARVGVSVIPGIELSVRAPHGQVHIVAYLPSCDPPTLRDLLHELQQARRVRAERIGARLAELGVPVDMTAVRASAVGSVGRPHLADALVAAGHADDRADAFARLLGDDAPAFVPHESLTARDAIGAVSTAGGITALAHPGTLRLGLRDLGSYVAHLRHLGLWGIEVYRAEHTPEQRDGYARIARSLGLVATGGSDFHGPETGRADLGETGMPPLPDGVAALIHSALGDRVASGP